MAKNSNELTSTTALTPVVDGLDGHTNAVDGAESRKQGLLRGTVLKFGNSGGWEDRDRDETINPEARFVLMDVKRVVVRWKDKRPEETIVLGPGEVIPDIERWNAQLPKAEWIEGPNGLRGPWQYQQIVYLIDPASMATYCWPTSSVGGSIAIDQVVDAVKAMRRFRPGACPVVELSSTYMKTRFGGRQRPHFPVRSWIGGVAGDDPAPTALPAPDTPPAAPAALAHVSEEKPAKLANKACPTMINSKSFAVGNAVTRVSLAEELNDEIPI